MSSDASDHYQRTLKFQEVLVGWATGSEWSEEKYEAERRALVGHPGLRKLIPPLVKDCHTLKAFWATIKQLSYAGRRQIIRDAFAPLLAELEKPSQLPLDEATALTLASLDVDHVQDAWRKALERRLADPEGAITAARTLLEGVCKSILDEEKWSAAGSVDRQLS